MRVRIVPSPEEVDRGKTPAGGWTRDQLAAWGIPWPPRKGWRSWLRDEWERASELDDVIAAQSRPLHEAAE